MAYFDCWIVLFSQSGEVKIFNHTTNEECKIKFHAYSYFSRERQRKVRSLVSSILECTLFSLSLCLSLSLSLSSPLDRYQVVFLMPMVVSGMSSRVTGMRSLTWPPSRVGRERTRKLALSSSSGRRRCHSKSLDKRRVYSIITSSLDK